MIFNEIYTPIFEKKYLIKPYERSVLQIQSVLAKNDKGTLKTFKFNEKPHSTMKKMFLLRYAEHLHLLITRAGCLVTKIYAHYTFEQSPFKKDFVVMSQVSRQKAKTKVEKYFYKLMNNSNFGYDCRNNTDNCSFKPIFDEIEEISYIQKYTSLYNNDVYKDFACPNIIKQQIDYEYNSDLMSIKEDDPCKAWIRSKASLCWSNKREKNEFC